MSQSWELTRPEIAGRVDIEILRALAASLPEKEYLLLDQTKPTELPGRFDGWGEPAEHLERLTALAADLSANITKVRTIGFTLLHEEVPPEEVGSNPGSWHIDDELALIIALGPTTEFPDGQLEVDDGVDLSDIRQMPTSRIPEEPNLEQDGISVYRPKEGEFVVLTNKFAHRAPRNHSGQTVKRLFMKFNIETQPGFWTRLPLLNRRNQTY